ncbi:MAG: pitrilysin family protein, partial [bacterium]|nr:pitrilysin family protein [bacterium]
AMVRGGSASDPNALPGLANFTAEMLSRGTTSRTARQIAQSFDRSGAQYSVNCDHDASYFTLTCLGPDLEKLLPVFMDLLQNPKMDSSEVERLRDQLVTSIQSLQDRPGTVSREAFEKLLYGQHQYNHRVAGEETAVHAIKPGDLAAYHKRYFVPNNTAIAIVGDVKPGNITGLFKKLTKSWAKAETPEIVFGQIPKIEKPGLRMTHMPITQSYVVLGFLGPRRLDPDYQAARLMNYILGGGGFVSRLVAKIRVQQGLAYDVDSYFSPRLDYGPYLFSVQTKCQSADTAIKTMIAEMERIQKEPVSDHELLEAKAYFRGSYPFRYETNGQIAGQLLGAELYGLSPDQVAKDMELIQKVSKEDILLAAQRLLKPQNFTAAMATDTAITRISIPGLTIEKK